ncbi:MAG TPA: hypothetical protein VFU76_15825 [Terriglobales bacterium]|nr:hypothetical protein [Terriglobales bacterium]
MPVLKLKIDLSGTVGDEAWRRLKHFDQVQAAFFGAEFGSSGPCQHPPGSMHPSGEWRGAEVLLANSLLAQYAMSHYLEQEGVLDADIEE